MTNEKALIYFKVNLAKLKRETCPLLLIGRGADIFQSRVARETPTGTIAKNAPP